MLAFVILIGISTSLLVLRAIASRKAGRTQVALPAVLNWGGTSWISFVRHGTLLLFLAGLPFFVFALADPYSPLTHQEVSYPGRRIALMIDASSSMMARVPGRAAEQESAERGDVFHHRRRGRHVHPAAHAPASIAT